MFCDAASELNRRCIEMRFLSARGVLELGLVSIVRRRRALDALTWFSREREYLAW